MVSRRQAVANRCLSSSHPPHAVMIAATTSNRGGSSSRARTLAHSGGDRAPAAGPLHVPERRVACPDPELPQRLDEPGHVLDRAGIRAEILAPDVTDRRPARLRALGSPALALAFQALRIGEGPAVGVEGPAVGVKDLVFGRGTFVRNFSMRALIGGST